MWESNVGQLVWLTKTGTESSLKKNLKTSPKTLSLTAPKR
jgi:hypothetical protein